MLGQRQRHWTDVVQMVCKCFVFASESGVMDALIFLYMQQPHASDPNLYVRFI